MPLWLFGAACSEERLLNKHPVPACMRINPGVRLNRSHRGRMFRTHLSEHAGRTLGVLGWFGAQRGLQTSARPRNMYDHNQQQATHWRHVSPPVFTPQTVTHHAQRSGAQTFGNKKPVELIMVLHSNRIGYQLQAKPQMQTKRCCQRIFGNKNCAKRLRISNNYRSNQQSMTTRIS